jgi:hypothetical protein
MKTTLAILFCFALLAVILLALPSQAVQALPEYSAQTGEPCASCHVSPSGGGPRGPRGQAWVGSGKPGAVPGLVDALAVLGVYLDVDESAYHRAVNAIPPAQAPSFSSSQQVEVHEWLTDYEGN